MPLPPKVCWAGLIAWGLTVSARPSWAAACPGCITSKEVWGQVAASSPLITLALLTTGFACVAILVLALARFAPRARRLFASTLLLGAGLGGFLDGIVLHQVLQWHAMLSNVIPPLDLVTSKVNMFWDGLFHLYCWCATLLAVGLIVRYVDQIERSSRLRLLCGGMLAGWGLFNLAEGALNHQLLGLHHVHPGFDEVTWDIAFLVFGVVLVVLGGGVSLSALRRTPSPRSPATAAPPS